MSHPPRLATGRARAVAAVIVMALVPCLSGCQDGLRIGTWQVIPPQAAVSATGVQITRTQESAASKPVASGQASSATTAPASSAATQPALLLNQKLAIDFSAGYATFTDTDGRLYPHQLSPEVVGQLREAIAGRTWQVGKLDSVDSAVDPIRYTLTVNDGSEALKEQAVWTNHPRKPVPESLKLFEDVMDRAHRIAHPLSETVDLLK